MRQTARQRHAGAPFARAGDLFNPDLPMATDPIPLHPALPDRVDSSDPANVAQWCEAFGITASQFEEAVAAAGTDPAALGEHLLNQGASAGAG